jgi:predicted enzyme related to lactoylglutathione lyase
MSEVSYEQGVFCWIDLSAHDVEAAKRWYSQVFGWELTSSSDSAMPYSMALQSGKMVAGFSQLPDAMKAQGVPPTWNSYAWVEDCKRVEAAALEAGAKVIVPTMQIGEFGSMAFLQDPEGAVIGLWQPGLHRGAQLVNEPNSLCWNELMTRDVGKAKDFYGTALGWSFQSLPMGDFEYVMLKVGERDNGGMMAMEGPMWEGVPPHWMVYFAVADVDATCKKIEETGGKVCVPPTDIPVGRFAVVNDPQGATFSVITLAKAAG